MLQSCVFRFHCSYPIWVSSNVNWLIMKVNSENKQGLLLEVVQILTDMNLIIIKSYISSDGGWFMDGTYVYISISHITQIIFRAPF